MATTTPTVVELAADSFQRALERYVDDNKPDRHVRQQMESWKLEWQSKQEGVVDPIGAESSSFSFEPTHLLAGELVWQGEYLKLTLATICYWKGTKKDGSIHFSCKVTKGEVTSADAATTAACDKKDAKTARRVRQKMIERLQKDDYVSKLVNQQHRQTLIEATVIVSSAGNLEERVYCDETTAEGIRRGIFTTGETSLDVFDWIVSLPILPSCAHGTDNGGVASESVTTPLADRVKLRSLEEATYDACEQLQDEKIVDDLHISKKTKSG